jgi:hypothetical protein
MKSPAALVAGLSRLKQNYSVLKREDPPQREDPLPTLLRWI